MLKKNTKRVSVGIFKCHIHKAFPYKCGFTFTGMKLTHVQTLIFNCTHMSSCYETKVVQY